MDLHKVYLVVFLLKLGLVVWLWAIRRCVLTEKCETSSNIKSEPKAPIA